MLKIGSVYKSTKNFFGFSEEVDIKQFETVLMSSNKVPQAEFVRNISFFNKRLTHLYYEMFLILDINEEYVKIFIDNKILNVPKTTNLIDFDSFKEII